MVINPTRLICFFSSKQLPSGDSWYLDQGKKYYKHYDYTYNINKFFGSVYHNLRR